MSVKNTAPDIFGEMVSGPGSLDLADDMGNCMRIAEWWSRVKIYAEAMDDLRRAVILKKHDDGTWYLASVESKL